MEQPLALPNDARSCVRTRENLGIEPDLGIAIELELRGDPRPRLRLAGNVRWSNYDPLLQKYRTGVAFTERSPEFERDLLRYIDTLHEIRAFGET